MRQSQRVGEEKELEGGGSVVFLAFLHAGRWGSLSAGPLDDPEDMTDVPQCLVVQGKVVCRVDSRGFSMNALSDEKQAGNDQYAEGLHVQRCRSQVRVWQALNLVRHLGRIAYSFSNTPPDPVPKKSVPLRFGTSGSRPYLEGHPLYPRTGEGS